MKELDQPFWLNNGIGIKNRWWLAPLTNTQANHDGSLSDDEYNWLLKRAEGGFGVVLTCAALAEASGQGFPGQFGVYDDLHLPGMTRLAYGIKEHKALALVQLHHAGVRTPAELAINRQPVGPSDSEKYDARGLTLHETEAIIESFVSSAERCQKAGFDGVEVHAAHSYLIAQFLSEKHNYRGDRFGGTLENRAAMLMDIVRKTRARCGEDFVIGVRLSPEGFGVDTQEMKTVFEWLVDSGWVNFIDLSLWDVRKVIQGGPLDGKLLIDEFMKLERGQVVVGVAGHIYSGDDARWCLKNGADFVLPGRAAILHYNFPKCVKRDPAFRMIDTPVTREYLKSQAVGRNFIQYLSQWDGFVAKS